MTDAPLPTPEDAPLAPETLDTPDLAAENAALRSQLIDAQAAATAAKDAQLRAAAEAENRIRRADREADNAIKFGAEKLLKELLSVADSLDLGLKAAGENPEGVAKALADGMSMTAKQLLATLEKQGLQAVDPTGQPMNAELHQAMTMAPATADVPAGHVLNTLQKGYTLHGRLLRPALVIVAQAA